MVKPATARSAWMALPWTLLGFPLAVMAGFGIFAAFGLCMESEKASCTDPAYPWPSWWHLAIIFVIAVMLVAGPSMVALRRGLRARKAGDTKALPVIVVSSVLIVLIVVVMSSGIW